MNTAILLYTSPFLELPESLVKRVVDLLPKKETVLLNIPTEDNRVIKFTAWTIDNLAPKWIFVDFKPVRDPDLGKLVFPFEIKGIMTFVEELDEQYYPTNYETFVNAQWHYITEIRGNSLRFKLPMFVFFMSRSTKVMRVETLNIDFQLENIQDSEDIVQVCRLLD